MRYLAQWVAPSLPLAVVWGRSVKPIVTRHGANPPQRGSLPLCLSRLDDKWVSTFAKLLASAPWNNRSRGWQHSQHQPEQLRHAGWEVQTG